MDISLREIQENDLEQIMEWRMRPDITRFMNTDPVLTLEKQREWLTYIRKEGKVKYWMILIQSRPVGIINLADIDWEGGSSSWGYYIGEKKARSFQAAMSLEMSLYDYVFDALSFKELHNEVFSLNRAVIKIHEACGSIVVREEKGEIVKCGVSYDVTHMSITRDDWLSIREKKKYEKINFQTDMRLHHIGYAVKNIEESAKKFEMGGYRKSSVDFDDTHRNVRIVFLKNADDGPLLELVAPLNENGEKAANAAKEQNEAQKSPVTRRLSLSHNTSEPYHLCYEVSNLNRMICELKRQSFYVVKPPEPAVAFHGKNVAFLLSRETGLLELLEKDDLF